jgi:serine/threonine protein kinase
MAFVMEMCGDSLFMVLHTPKACHWTGALKPIGLPRLVGWAGGIADALAYLHACSPKIVHRDVKTHNLLLAGDGSLKLCDFGLVHHPDTGAGTPQYMAPELLAGGKHGYTDKVDVYAFGIMLWEVRVLLASAVLRNVPSMPLTIACRLDCCASTAAPRLLRLDCCASTAAPRLLQMLARRIPFAGWRMEDIVEQAQEGSRPKVTDIPADRITPDLRALMEECWAQEPSTRPSMAQVAAKLKAWKPPRSAVASTTRRVGGDALDALMR